MAVMVAALIDIITRDNGHVKHLGCVKFRRRSVCWSGRDRGLTVVVVGADLGGGAVAER